MQIQWLGLGSFRIQTKDAVFITDPYSDDFGLSMPKMKADVVISSDRENALANNFQRLQGDPMIVDGPGEYEIKGTFIYGSAAASNTLYVLEDEGVSVAFLGGLDSGLTDAQLSKMEGAHILLLPIGTLSKESRTTLVSQIEPRIIVPYYAAQKGVKNMPNTLITTEEWLKEAGIDNTISSDKLSIKAKDLPTDQTDTYILATD